MKRFLLTTTALATMVSGFALAEVSVKIGGSTEFQVGSSSQSSGYDKVKTVSRTSTVYDTETQDYKTYNDYYYPISGSKNQKSYAANSSARVYVSAQGKADNGLMYGANVTLTPRQQAKNGYGDGKTAKSYMWLESAMGRVEMGSNAGVAQLMKIDAGTIASATGGASAGDYTTYVRYPGDSGSEENSSAYFVTSGDTLLYRTRSSAEEPRKITWMSPRYSGLQFGMSFSPDLYNVGTGSADASDARVDLRNGYELGLNYSNSFDNMNLAAAATYEYAKNVATTDGVSGTDKNLRSYTLGFAVGYDSLTFAASYGDDGKSIATNTDNVAKSKYWTAGVAYETGPLTSSLTYFDSKYRTATGNIDGTSDLGTNKVKAYSLGLDYKLASGLTPYLEVTRFEFNSSSDFEKQTTTDQPTLDNKGTVVMVGSKLSF